MTETQQARGRVIDEVGGAAKNQARKALGRLDFISKYNGKPLGFGIGETHNRLANGCQLHGGSWG